MAFSISKSEIIDYPPEKLRTFNLSNYEWIDNLNFTLKPKDFLDNFETYLKIVNERFLEAGWNGDGEIELMWIPPFMFPNINADNFYKGVVIWHVKQKEDGISWILSPIKLPNL